MKYISYIGYGLLAISVILFITFLGTGNFSSQEFPFADLLLYWMYAMIISASALAVILPMINMASDPKKMVGSLIGGGAMVLLVLVCYLMADATPIVGAGVTYDDRFELLSSDTGLYATYFTFAGAVIAIIVGEVWKMVKR